MNALAAAVCTLMGWADGESLRARLARVAPVVAVELGLPPAPDCWASDRRMVFEVAQRCTVNETYFFRHADQLRAVCAELPRAFPRQPLLAWSAACSTGEEAYTLSMLLLDGGQKPEQVRVVGTDVSDAALRHARAAGYPEWSFRGVPREVRERCFQPKTSALHPFEVRERYRQPVSFQSHNLLAPPPLPQAHLICCRNVLIYFEAMAAQEVLRHLDRVLLPGGYLLLGTAEQHLARALGYETKLLSGVVLLRKPELRKPSAQRPRQPEPLALARQPLPLAEPTSELPVPRAETSPPAPTTRAAWDALLAGKGEQARALASALVAADPEAHLVLAALDEAAGEPARALEHVRRALYLDPRLVIAHVAQASLFRRLGREKDAVRARANALRHLHQLPPETILRAVIPVTARELRSVLEVQ